MRAATRLPFLGGSFSNWLEYRTGKVGLGVVNLSSRAVEVQSLNDPVHYLVWSADSRWLFSPDGARFVSLIRRDSYHIERVAKPLRAEEAVASLSQSPG